MANAPMFKATNVFLRFSNDPTGNGQPTAELVVQKADGSVVSSALYLYEHGGQKLALFRGNGADSTVFETDPTNGRVIVNDA
jgi:hypothetical protein